MDGQGEYNLGMPYRFRLRFCLPTDTNIEIEEPVVDIPASLLAGGPYVLKSVGEKPIRESHALIINSLDFTTESAALAAGEAARAALLYTAAKLRFGVDIGRNTPIGVIGQALKDRFREEQRAELRSDVHGLTVYDDTIERVFASFSASATVGKSGPRFLQVLAHVLERNLLLAEKETLALELFNSLHFESSVRARFLTLVTIVEALSDYTARPSKASTHVERLIAETNEAELEPGERVSILGALKWMRFQSIGQKTRALVAAHLSQTTFDDKRADKFFTDCYEIRSIITHYGKTPPEVVQLLPELERLVGELLYSIVEQPAT